MVNSCILYTTHFKYRIVYPVYPEKDMPKVKLVYFCNINIYMISFGQILTGTLVRFPGMCEYQCTYY